MENLLLEDTIAPGMKADAVLAEAAKTTRADNFIFLFVGVPVGDEEVVCDVLFSLSTGRQSTYIQKYTCAH